MNVIGSRPDGWWRDRDGAVRRLVARLQRLAATGGSPITVVADGRPLADLPRGRARRRDGAVRVAGAQRRRRPHRRAAGAVRRPDRVRGGDVGPRARRACAGAARRSARRAQPARGAGRARRKASADAPLRARRPPRCSRGSMRVAAQSARPSALHIASARWWSFSPLSTRACSVSFASVAIEHEQVLDQRRRQLADAVERPRHVDGAVRPAADVDRDRRQRLVQRHRRVGHAHDALPVAERAVERLPDARCRRPRPCGARRRAGRPSP